MLSKSRVNNEPADLRRTIDIPAQREIGMAKHLFEALRITLVRGHLQVKISQSLQAAQAARLQPPVLAVPCAAVQRPAGAPLGQRRPPPPACGGLRPVPWSQAFPQGRSATAAVLLRAACRAGPLLQRRRSRG